MRILHVVGGMNRGGVETWLMHVLRNIDRERFRFDFLVHTTKPCAYDEEIRSLGSSIIPCMKPSRPWLYASTFKRILKEHGPYDVVHSHVHHYSGFVLRQAHKAGIPKRIAHSHNDTSSSELKAGVARKTYLNLMKRLIRMHATKGLACSRKAAVSLYGKNWEADSRWQILYCGIDLDQFTNPPDRGAIRKELGIPLNAFVVGHVGRFAEQKNHTFLVDIFNALAKREPKAWLLLVGDGPLRHAIERKIDQLDLKERVVFAGLRSDVPHLMKGAMDVFLLPSLHEGLPVVLIEAQAANIPCIFSDVITYEVDIIPELIHRELANSTDEFWASTILIHKEKLNQNQTNNLTLIKLSPFNIDISMEKLSHAY